MANEAEPIPAVATWAAFAEEVGGVFTEGPHSRPSIMQIAAPGTVQYTYKGFQVLLDTIVSQGAQNQPVRLTTRLRTLISNPGGFRFKIYRELDSLFATALKFVKLLKDVEIGDPEFDAQFIMRGTDEELVKRFFSDKTMQAHLASMPQNALLEIRDKDANIFKKKLPGDVDILVWSSRPLLEDLDALRSTRELFNYVLQQLIAMDAVQELPPDVFIADYA